MKQQVRELRRLLGTSVAVADQQPCGAPQLLAGRGKQPALLPGPAGTPFLLPTNAPRSLTKPSAERHAPLLSGVVGSPDTPPQFQATPTAGSSPAQPPCPALPYRSGPLARTLLDQLPPTPRRCPSPSGFPLDPPAGHLHPWCSSHSPWLEPSRTEGPCPTARRVPRSPHSPAPRARRHSQVDKGDGECPLSYTP